MNGAEQIKKFEAAGFSPEEIQQWSSTQAQRLGAAGFKQEEIGKWFGQKPEPDNAKANGALAKYVTGVISDTKQTASDVATLYGPVEAALNVASSFIAGFPAYLGGGAGSLIARHSGIGDPDQDPKEVATRYAQAVTYQPFSEAGRRLSDTLLLPLADLTAGSEKAGKKVTDLTGSPHLGALTEATIQMLPAFFIGALGRRLSGKTPTNESIRDTATATIGTPDEAAVSHVAEKLKTVYEKTGLDPEVIYDAARSDPTIVQDLASQNIEVPKAIVETLPAQPSVKNALQDFLDATGKRWAMEEQGQAILDTMGDRGVSPQSAAKQFWSDTYFKLPAAVQERFVKMLKKNTGMEPGSVLWKNAETGETKVAENWQDIADILDLGDSAENLQGTERGFVALMEEANNRVSSRIQPSQTLIKYEPGSVRADLAKSVGFWEGPKPMDVEFTDIIPSKAEQTKAFLVEGRHWYASEGTSAKDILAKGQAAVEAGKTPEAALGEAMPPPPPEKPPLALEETGRSDAERTILSKINTDESGGRKWTFDKLYTELIDRFNPIKTVEKLAGEGKLLPSGQSPYELQRLTAGIFGKGNQFLKYGPFDFDTYKINGPSYEKALSTVRDDLDGFRAYMVSRRAIELEGRGIESGFDLEAAHQVVKDGGKFEEAFNERIKYRDALVDYLVGSGLLSKDAAAAMREANKAYVPFYRFFEGETRPMSGTQPRTPIKRIKGSEREIIDPIVSDIKDTFLFLSLAEKNAARQAFANMGPEFAKPVKAPMRPVDITDEVSKALKTAGIEADPEQFTAFRPQSYAVAEDQITVFENGKRKVYEVDPEVARAFNSVNAGSASILASGLRAAASWLRAGVTLSPDFIMRNPLRDAVSAFVYVGSHPINTVKGAISLWKKDEAFQRWQMGGGANATMVAIDRNYIGKELFDLNERTGFMDATWNMVKSPFEALRIASEIMENITRLGAVRDELLIAKDKAQIQALSLIAREATVDFARHGADPFFQQWQRATAFMNPAIQGIDLMFRKGKENILEIARGDEKVIAALTGVFAKAFASITLPSLYLWWVNHDDPRWKDIPNWERDMFWIVMTPKAVYRVPKPFELGVLFGSVPERMLDSYVDSKPDAFKQFGSTMLNVFGFNVIPTVGIPPLEQMTNYSMFTDRPIIPHSMEKWLPEYQYTPYTTQTTRALGHIIGTLPNMHDKSIASPVVIDNYIRGWSGTIGTYAVQLADLALRKTGVLPDPIRPASTLSDIPGIKAFAVRYPSAQAQSIQDFHDSYAKATKVVATVQHLALSGDAAAALREAQLSPDMMVKLDGVSKGLANAQRMIQMVDQNPSMKADEKRQLIDATYMQMIQMATAGNSAVRDLQKSLKSTVTVH